jgi:hypothetical protein
MVLNRNNTNFHTLFNIRITVIVLNVIGSDVDVLTFRITGFVGFVHHTEFHKHSESLH